MVVDRFFAGSTDIFITEYGKGDDMFFGYTILNGDSQMSEWGYQSVEELTNSDWLELDFHWQEKTMEEALYEADSDYFRKPDGYDEPTDTDSSSDELTEEEELEMLELEAEALEMELMMK